MFLENPVFIVVAPVIFQIPGNWSLLLCLPCCSWGSECAQVKVNLSKPSIFTSTSCKCWLPRYCHHVASNCLPKDHAVHLVLLDMLRHQRRQGPQRARRTQQTMGRDPHCYCSDRFSLWICFHCFIFFCKESTFACRSDICDQHVVCKMVGQTAECFDRRKTGEVLKWAFWTRMIFEILSCSRWGWLCW